MSPTTQTGTLSDRANLALACLHAHHLLTTRQLHQLLDPPRDLRGTQRLTALLAQRGLVDRVRRRAGGRDGESVWYLTAAGTDVVQAVPGVGPSRSRPLNRQLAEGQLQPHTLAVNAAGIAFVKAARKRGDDCGPLAWEHEVVHRAGNRRTDVVISDAVLRYQPHPDEGFQVAYRFLELDRATTPVERLHQKLESYARVATYIPQGATEPGWRSRYLGLPGVLLILTGASRDRLERRAGNLIRLAETTQGLGVDPQIAVWICTLGDLTDHGPYAPIFTLIHERGAQCDWLGEGGHA